MYGANAPNDVRYLPSINLYESTINCFWRSVSLVNRWGTCVPSQGKRFYRSFQHYSHVCLGAFQANLLILLSQCHTKFVWGRSSTCIFRRSWGLGLVGDRSGSHLARVGCVIKRSIDGKCSCMLCPRYGSLGGSLDRKLLP
jgi:hypothetical protein